MLTSRDQWWCRLDELNVKLNWAQAFLRELETQGYAEAAERAKQQISSLMNEICQQRARPFST